MYEVSAIDVALYFADIDIADPILFKVNTPVFLLYVNDAVPLTSTSSGLLVNVTVYVPLTSITIDPVHVDLYPEQEQELAVEFNPEGATNKTVVWSIEDTTGTNVASINSTTGKVTANNPGDATVTATVTDNGNVKTATATVHVYKRVTGATIKIGRAHV